MIILQKIIIYIEKPMKILKTILTAIFLSAVVVSCSKGADDPVENESNPPVQVNPDDDKTNNDEVKPDEPNNEEVKPDEPGNEEEKPEEPKEYTVDKWGYATYTHAGFTFKMKEECTKKARGQEAIKYM